MVGAIATVEAIKPVRVRFRDTGTTYDMLPGQRAELPEDQARRLLQAVPDKVRLVASLTVASSRVGWRVTWTSPLFGLLSAVVLEDSGQTVTVWHPLTDREATIPTNWLQESST